MPGWADIGQEIQAAVSKQGPSGLDSVRRKYLVKLHQRTKRAVILYATRWTQMDPRFPPESVAIMEQDVQGLMTVFHGVKEKKLDLILHSPGGSLDAVEGVVEYLREKFMDIRVFVPQSAMSAATMICCAAERIVLGKHSFLGPIDPQFILKTPLGSRSVAAQDILDQFKKAQSECAEDPAKLGVWMPMLNQYGPDLLVACEHAGVLAKDLVTRWLRRYMFKGLTAGPQKAARIADWLSSHKDFKSHGRHLSRGALEKAGLVIDKLEELDNLQDVVLSVFHATTHTMGMSGTVTKIIENHLGRAFIEQLPQRPPSPQPPLPSRRPPMPPAQAG